VQPDCSTRSHQKSCLDLVPEIDRILMTAMLHCSNRLAAPARKCCASDSRNCTRRLRPRPSSLCVAQRNGGLGISDFDPLNGRYGEIRCFAKSVLPQLQTIAASAAWLKVNVGKVPRCVSSSALQRKASVADPVIGDQRGEGVERAQTYRTSVSQQKSAFRASWGTKSNSRYQFHCFKFRNQAC
jgi:hypothetical protein